MLIKFMLDKHEEKLSQSIIITFGEHDCSKLKIKTKSSSSQLFYRIKQYSKVLLRII